MPDASAPGAAAPVATALSSAASPAAAPEQAARIVTAGSLGLPVATDSGNAELIASLYGELLRFDHKQRRWLIWNKKRHQWGEDTSNTVRLHAIEAARRRRQLAAKITDEKEAKAQFRWSYQSENRPQIDAALDIVKSLAPISDSGDKWDADPWLFGVANGVVDLRTGTLREETQDDRITKHSPIRYDPCAECPRFEIFLCEISNYDAELSWYLRKASGYSLTGLTREQCVFCCHGPGSNGKTTLLETLHYISGDYAQNLPFSALELKNRNNNDLVRLAGCRFATASETNEGVRLNEARIKALTGGDLITARRLYHESFTFPPTHKLWLAFNHKPIIADDSEGMWRRVHLIPFTRQFRAEEQDKDLLEKLKAESPGILAWAVAGCLAWQREGLGMPPAVAHATAAYREESDHLGQFIEDCCVISPVASVPSGMLWQRYQVWARVNEEVPLSRNTFGERLERRGVTRGRTGREGTRILVGIGLRADTLTPADTISDNLLTRENSIGKKTESASARVSTSAGSSKPTPNVGSGHPADASQKGADTKKRVLEVEI